MVHTLPAIPGHRSYLPVGGAPRVDATGPCSSKALQLEGFAARSTHRLLALITSFRDTSAGLTVYSSPRQRIKSLKWIAGGHCLLNLDLFAQALCRLYKRPNPPSSSLSSQDQRCSPCWQSAQPYVFFRQTTGVDFLGQSRAESTQPRQVRLFAVPRSSTRRDYLLSLQPFGACSALAGLDEVSSRQSLEQQSRAVALAFLLHL